MQKTKNEYHLCLVDAQTGKTKQELTFHNVVTNKAYDGLLMGRTPSSSINIGIGSGTPSPTDTSLFTWLWSGTSSITVSQAKDQLIWTMTLSIPAEQCVGNLTELGIGSRDSLATHAMFADSEGNPIAINKTATDILYITAILRYSFFSTPHPDEGTTFFAANWSWLYGPVQYSNNYANVYALLREPEEYELGIRNGYFYIGKAFIVSAGVVSATIELNYTTFNDWNNGNGFEIAGFLIEGIGMIKVTPEVFPSRAFGKYQVGVGDGTNRYFDIKTPSCKAGTQKVYIDGVLKTEGVDYTFKPYNAKDFCQNYASTQRKHIVSFNNADTKTYCPLPTYPSMRWGDVTSIIIKDHPTVWDFGVPQKVNFVLSPGTSNYDNNTRLQYSTDNITWTTYTTFEFAKSNVPKMFDEVTARYWRISCDHLTNNTGRFISPSLSEHELVPAFGYYEPSITFNTPPPVDSVVEVDYDIQYPFKNNRRTIKMDVGFTFSR